MTTHGALECVQASGLVGAMLWQALFGAGKDVILVTHGVTDRHPAVSHPSRAESTGAGPLRRSVAADMSWTA